MNKSKLFQIICGLCALSLTLGIYGCNQENEADVRLDLAESMMESRPDSALFILDEVEETELRSIKGQARYALLKSMALDKNGIDTTTLDVLQPAIDHYLKSGTPDEKLRTYYYKGRIHENAGEDDLAMQTYLTVLENSDDITDSLTLARLLVAQGREFYRQYRIEDFTKNNLQAASLYAATKPTQRLQCLKRAVSGAIILNDRFLADSIYDLCLSMVKDNPSIKPSMTKTSLMYALKFGKVENLAEILEGIQSNDITEDMKLHLARAYSKLGNLKISLQYLEEAYISSDCILDSLTYWSVKTEILENLNEDGKALESFKNYSRLLESYHDQLFSNELLFSEKKHEMELEKIADIQKRDRMIQWISVGSAVLLIFTLLIYYRYRINKARRMLAERNAENLQLEGERKKLLAEKLESERVRLELANENLRLRMDELERERDQLKELLESQNTLSDDARQLIRERIEMLNGLFAQALTEQESYGKEFKKYVQRIKKDKNGFQESLVKVLDTTHPGFIAELKAHGLTERELHYCCLYAIGLRGKDIGTYLDLARHYNISTEVRRKLGLDPNDKNLGPFLRILLAGK